MWIREMLRALVHHSCLSIGGEIVVSQALMMLMSLDCFVGLQWELLLVVHNFASRCRFGGIVGDAPELVKQLRNVYPSARDAGGFIVVGRNAAARRLPYELRSKCTSSEGCGLLLVASTNVKQFTLCLVQQLLVTCIGKPFIYTGEGIPGRSPVCSKTVGIEGSTSAQSEGNPFGWESTLTPGSGYASPGVAKHPVSFARDKTPLGVNLPKAVSAKSLARTKGRTAQHFLGTASCRTIASLGLARNKSLVGLSVLQIASGTACTLRTA